MGQFAFAHGRGAGNRRGLASATSFQSHALNSVLPVQGSAFVPQHFPFQPLPIPTGSPPFRFDLSKLLTASAISQITQSGKLVFHSIGDTGDDRGTQMDFVASMITQDYDASAAGEAPAFCYHLGDVVYFAGDIDDYGECYYETYSEYPGLIVAIAGNHDCQPDDPQDGPVDPNKKPLDGWCQNFMSTDPTRLGSLKTNSSRTQMDLPNVYWTFTTPFATIIGLFSNVSETEAQVQEPQVSWFKGELTAAAADDKNKALIVAIHHPPYSGDDEHSGSTAAEALLFEAFRETGVYPHLILSGHVHNYQRFTVTEQQAKGAIEIPCVVLGNGGYTKLGTLRQYQGGPPPQPLTLTPTLSLEKYDDANFGFVRFEVTQEAIVGEYYSAPFLGSTVPKAVLVDTFTIALRPVS